jgi:hypothetical protein
VPGSLYLTTWDVVLLVGLVLALSWSAFLTWRDFTLRRRLRVLLEIGSGGHLDETLHSYLDEVREAMSQVRDLHKLTHRLEIAARHSLQHLGVVRFNPFADAGGNQSFAIALVDGLGNGVVISSLHAREGTRVYAKPLAKWESSHSLTEEEKRAIALAYQQQTS